jgi:hypothetical protein
MGVVMRINQYAEVDEQNFDRPSVVERIIQQLSGYEEAFKAGDKSSLFSALCLCSQYQAVIPVWATDAILQGQTDLHTGECKDFNALFGWEPSIQRNRQREAMINDNSGTVVAMLVKHRCDGGNLNAEGAFGTVSDQTGLPRRIVAEIYKRHQQAIKSIPQGDTTTHGTMLASLPMLRRYGRKIL